MGLGLDYQWEILLVASLPALAKAWCAGIVEPLAICWLRTVHSPPVHVLILVVVEVLVDAVTVAEEVDHGPLSQSHPMPATLTSRLSMANLASIVNVVATGIGELRPISLRNILLALVISPSRMFRRSLPPM
jgi:hypothetical protein